MYVSASVTSLFVYTGTKTKISFCVFRPKLTLRYVKFEKEEGDIYEITDMSRSIAKTARLSILIFDAIWSSIMHFLKCLSLK